MTSLAESAAKSSARGRLLWLALALSLTLNVCFVGGLVWSRMTSWHMLTPAERMQLVTREFHLTPDQRDAFRQFVLEIHHRTRQLRESNGPLVQRIWEELGKPQPDQDAIGKLMDEATENRHAYQRNMIVVLSHFLSSLSPEQRAQFIERVKRPEDRLRHLIIP